MPVVEDAQGHITLEYHGRQLDCTLYQRQPRQAEVVPSKHLAAAIAAVQHKSPVTIPAANHPWRRFSTPLSTGDAAERTAAPGPQRPSAGRD